MNKKNNHVVYKASVDGETVYIGSGALGREKHCNSGCSHVYDLNKLHFEGVEINVTTIRIGLSKEESLRIEKDLILKFRPRFNTNFLRKDVTDKMSLSSKISKLLLKEFIKEFGDRYREYKEPISEVIKFIGITNLINGCYIPSEHVGRSSLDHTKARTFYRNIRNKETRDRYEKVFSVIFEYKRTECDIWLKLKDVAVDLEKSDS